MSRGAIYLLRLTQSAVSNPDPITIAQQTLVLAPPLLVFLGLLLFPLLIAIIAIAIGVLAVLSWIKSYWGVLARIYYSLTVLLRRAAGQPGIDDGVVKLGDEVSFRCW